MERSSLSLPSKRVVRPSNRQQEALRESRPWRTREQRRRSGSSIAQATASEDVRGRRRPGDDCTRWLLQLLPRDFAFALKGLCTPTMHLLSLETTPFRLTEKSMYSAPESLAAFLPTSTDTRWGTNSGVWVSAAAGDALTERLRDRVTRVPACGPVT